jgi:membrane-associated phospholipid phosphatase
MSGIAVAAAAHTILIHLFPAQRVALDAALAASIAAEPAGPERVSSMKFGAAVAEAVFAMRARDGWNAAGTTRAGTAPGQWRPTPSRFEPSLDPQWANLLPFALTSPNQFRPSGPPVPGSAALREAAATVASIGAIRSSVRTPTQTEIARYWSDAIGTYAPAGHWNAIAVELVEPLNLGMASEAELFARLNVAMADAGIAVADAKYTYWFWRPITAIRTGGAGVGPLPDWTPLLETPNHPSYISGHSGFSGAAAIVLTQQFGTRPFTFVSASLPGVARSFTSFDQAAEEAAASRVYGGIHFPFDNAEGLATGHAVGAWTLSAFRRIAEDRGPVIVMDRPAGRGIRTVAGFALDNVSPVNAVTITPDGGEPFRVAVDERGRFAVSPARAEMLRRRAVAVAVTSSSGRMAAAREEIDGSGQGGAVMAPVIVK